MIDSITWLQIIVWKIMPADDGFEIVYHLCRWTRKITKLQCIYRKDKYLVYKYY